ncbi:unnamed protein product [Symbiodinium sp. CCMP2592]|nr:unnamed protein product [Symbiodinium sp. CCMP2592]
MRADWDAEIIGEAVVDAEIPDPEPAEQDKEDDGSEGDSEGELGDDETDTEVGRPPSQESSHQKAAIEHDAHVLVREIRCWLGTSDRCAALFEQLERQQLDDLAGGANGDGPRGGAGCPKGYSSGLAGTISRRRCRGDWISEQIYLQQRIAANRQRANIDTGYVPGEINTPPAAKAAPSGDDQDIMAQLLARKDSLEEASRRRELRDQPMAGLARASHPGKGPPRPGSSAPERLPPQRVLAKRLAQLQRFSELSVLICNDFGCIWVAGSCEATCRQSCFQLGRLLQAQGNLWEQAPWLVCLHTGLGCFLNAFYYSELIELKANRAKELRATSQTQLREHGKILQRCFKCSRACQVMFDSWWQRLARSRQAALADGDPLREFLLCLLDASYFELDGIGQLQLRVPAAVPPLPPVPDKELIEILSYKASSHSSAEPLTKDWIRDKLLVPKSVVSSTSSSQRSRGCAAYAPKPRSSSARGAQGSSRARPSSARPSSTRSAARSSSSGPVPRWSMSDASAEGSFFNDSERPSSTRCPVPGGLRLRHPLQEREKANLPYRVPPPSSAKSAEQVEAKVKAKAPVPHAAHAPAAHVPTAPAPAVVAARAANAVYPSHQRRRPASAKIHKHKRVAEPEEDIIYEDVEGPHVDRGSLRAPGSSGDAQAPETERPASIPSHEAVASQAKRHHRAWRPASAKVHKHKRVERCENAEDIYDDLEPSLAESSDFSGQEDAASPDKPFEDAEELTPPSQGVDVWIHQESRGEAFHGHFEFVAPRRSSPPSLDRQDQRSTISACLSICADLAWCQAAKDSLTRVQCKKETCNPSTRMRRSNVRHAISSVLHCGSFPQVGMQSLLRLQLLRGQHVSKATLVTDPGLGQRTSDMFNAVSTFRLHRL